MLLRGIQNQYFATFWWCLQPTWIQHLCDVNIILILRSIPLFHLLEHVWWPKRVIAHVLVWRQLQILGYLGIPIVALLVVAFELFESVLILACRPILSDEHLGGLCPPRVLKVLEYFEGASLRDCTVVWLVSPPVRLIPQAKLGSILVDEEGDLLLAMSANGDWSR
jgi:hypothetical protein